MSYLLLKILNQVKKQSKQLLQDLSKQREADAIEKIAAIRNQLKLNDESRACFKVIP
jgi:hypothetical protein